MALAPRSVLHRLDATSDWGRVVGDMESVTITGYPPGTAFQVDIGDGVIRDFTTLAAQTGDITLYAGRMNTLSDPALIAALPEAIPQGDGTASLDLTAEAMREPITLPDTRTVVFLPRAQAAGWGEGRFYYLAKRPDGRFDVRPGTNHRKIHTTPGGLTAEQIADGDSAILAALTGSSPGSWLRDNRLDLGSTPALALSVPLAYALWDKITGLQTSSHWILFERGHTYDRDMIPAALVRPGTYGESLLHPLLIGAYGTGAPPHMLRGVVGSNGGDMGRAVFQDLEIASGMSFRGGSDIIFDHVAIVHGIYGHGLGLEYIDVAPVDRITLHRCMIVDQFRDAPVDGASTWAAHINRAGGLYATGANGVLIDSCIFDHNGWEDGYDPVNGSAEFGQPPSMYSHNAYIQSDTRDITVRDSIFMRSASQGLMLRPGGYVHRCAMIDNAVNFSTLGGDYQNDGPIGNYTLLLDCVVTSAGHRRAPEHEGGLSIGVDLSARDNTFVNSIIAHMANPDDPAEIAAKTVHHGAYYANKLPDYQFYDDTVVWRWWTDPAQATAPKNMDRNVEGRDVASMNATTIQNYAAELLGTSTATIADFADIVRDPDSTITGGTVYDWFAEGFGVPNPKRTTPATLVFRPDERGEGFRWDNPLNWSTGDLPMDGDTVDLNGNRVLFGGQDVTVASVALNGGSLEVNSGRLIVADGQTEGIAVTGCGELA